MRIILKPFGVVVLLSAMLALTVVAFRNNSRHGDSSASGTAVVQASAVSTEAAASPAVSAASAAEGAAAPAPLRDNVIYREGSENTWQTRGWTWAKNVDFMDTTNAHSGNHAIKATLTNYDGIKFHHSPFPSHDFDRVAFWAYGGAKGGQKLQFGATCVSSEKAAPGSTAPVLPAGKWVMVVVPLTTIGTADKPNMDSFWIQIQSGTPQPTLWIDDIQLLKPGQATPAGALIATVG